MRGYGWYWRSNLADEAIRHVPAHAGLPEWAWPLPKQNRSAVSPHHPNLVANLLAAWVARRQHRAVTGFNPTAIQPNLGKVSRMQLKKTSFSRFPFYSDAHPNGHVIWS